MELKHEFRVPLAVDEAWAVLTDLERIAPCMPGAQLLEVVDEEYRGVVKVKLGAITAQYRGAASFAERDPEAHRAVIKAEGRDVRGQGTAGALITAVLEPEQTATRVMVTTDLRITGRVAQFGRGLVADVSGKLLDQFVDALKADLAAARTEPESGGESGPESGGESGGEGETTAPKGRSHQDEEVKAVDLLRTAGGPVLRRLGPLLALIIAIAVVVWLVLR